MSLKDGFVRLDIWPYLKSESVAQENRRSVFPRWGLYVALTSCVTVSCGTPHATLQFTAPANVTAGTPFTITVTVLYKGKVDTVINTPLHFSSSDPAATLPANYYFTPSDAGSHTWTNGFVLVTPGSQTLSGFIYLTSSVTESGINGSTKITVSPAVSH